MIILFFFKIVNQIITLMLNFTEEQKNDILMLKSTRKRLYKMRKKNKCLFENIYIMDLLKMIFNMFSLAI
jgi:hypothetical protein